MPNLCQYKDLLGAPNTGVHAIRVFDFAIVDIALTVFLAAIITAFISSLMLIIPNDQSTSLTILISLLTFILIFILLIVLGIFLHWFFCVETKLNKLLGL
jgi:hypothetical protein